MTIIVDKSYIESPVTISVTCKHCGHSFSFIVQTEDFENFMFGEDTLSNKPYLTAEERELLESQLCDSCWHEQFDEEF